MGGTDDESFRILYQPLVLVISALAGCRYDRLSQGVLEWPCIHHYGHEVLEETETLGASGNALHIMITQITKRSRHDGLCCNLGTQFWNVSTDERLGLFDIAVDRAAIVCSRRLRHDYIVSKSRQSRMDLVEYNLLRGEEILRLD